MQDETESNGEENVFFFEGDHLALRGNPDYCNVLRTIVMLQAQKLRVHQQIEELTAAKQVYLDNPELLLEKLQKQEPLIAPNYMSIVKLPELVGKYELLPQTEPPAVKLEPNEPVATSSSINHNLMQQTVRGRLVDNTKSETFNRLWTNDEQRRLEQLLVEYPVEEIEMRRFTKIAKALGNRTPQQVSSRVQKYFQKLHEAGMPVPGRIPKHRRPGGNKQKHYYRPSTFFPAHNISMHMPEDDFMLDRLHGLGSPAPPDDVAIKVEMKTEAEEDSEHASADDDEAADTSQKLLLTMLKAICDEKVKTADGYNPDPLASKCAECDEATVARTRWRCNSCYCHMNFCLDCLTAQLLEKRFEHITHDVVVEQEM